MLKILDCVTAAEKNFLAQGRTRPRKSFYMLQVLVLLRQNYIRDMNSMNPMNHLGYPDAQHGD